MAPVVAGSGLVEVVEDTEVVGEVVVEEEEEEAFVDGFLEQWAEETAA